MALLNQSCIVHYDKEGNITRFLSGGEKVYYTRWTKDSNMDKNDVLVSNIEEIKGCSDKNDTFYLFCLNSEGDIEIYMVAQDIVSKSKFVVGDSNLLLRDFRPYIIGEQCELLISHSKLENRNERVLTKYTLNLADIDVNVKYIDFEAKDLMVYETFGPVDEIAVVNDCDGENAVISIIEKNEDANSIVLLRDNRFGYVEGLIKISMNYEIYWHDIMITDEKVMIVFTIKDGNFFTIKFITYDRKTHNVSGETTVRKKAPCSHPVILNYMGETWICWYENGSVYSSTIKNGAINKGPMKWKDSLGKKVFCASFIIDDQEVIDKYQFNARKVFITYPDNNMTGFGKF